MDCFGEFDLYYIGTILFSLCFLDANRFLEAKNVENHAVFNGNLAYGLVLFLGFAFLCLSVYFFVCRTIK